MALLGKNKKADTQNGFGTASSFQNQPGNANWEILEMIMEIQMETHLGIIMETGQITLVVHHLAELEVLVGMMDLVRLIII